MAYSAWKYSTETSNVLPGLVASVALSVGHLVYIDSNGQWALADSVDISSTTPMDAVGVVVRDALQYEVVSPVKVAEISGYSGLTAGAKQYLSATAGAVIETEPSTTRRQQVGVAVTTSIIRFDVGGAGAQLDVGGDIVVDTSTISDSAADANSNGLTIQKDRAGAIVENADALGYVNFSGYNGTSYDIAAQILSEVAAAPGASADMPGKLTIKACADGSATLSAIATFAAGSITLADSVNIVVNTSTGTQIGTAAAQKLGFFGATPVVQQAHIADSAGDDATAVNAILSALETFGFLATS